MHPSLEKRLRGGLLALGIGIGSLGSGCATNNPALNALMNYGVAPILAADAGRSQQTVVVNGGQQVNSPQAWESFSFMSFDDLNGNSLADRNELRNVKDIFYSGENVFLGIYGSVSVRKIGYDLFKDGVKIIENTVHATHPLGTGSLTIPFIPPHLLFPGEYSVSWYGDGVFVGKHTFKVLEKQITRK